MSDNSNSTGSSGSSANSWTLLSPEEAAVENVGPVDDGTESLSDVPSLSEEVAGAAMELKPSDIPIETVLSEEGHQVCQETSPESSEGPVPSSPSRISPLPPNILDPSDLDLESQPPIIHDIDTSSPSDNEHLGATPFVADIDYGAQLEILAAEPPAAELEEACCAPPMTASELELEVLADTGPDPISPADVLPAAEPEVSVVRETIRSSGPPSNTEEDISPKTDSTEPLSRVPKISAAERYDEESLAPETISSVEAEAEEEEESLQKEETQPAEIVTQEDREEEEEPSSSFHLDDSGSFDDDGLRRRHVPPFEAPRPRTSDEEDEEEEAEFRLAERKEEKPWFSLNKCIVGALVLLFLGSLFLSGDFDSSELSDGEQSQDWLNGDPQDMKELLDKLTQENQQIAQLEAQLQSQKDELDAALTAVAASGDEKGKADLEKENTKLKEELSSLPNLKKELEGLRARVTELSQLTAVQEAPPAAPSSAPPPANKDGHSKQSSAGPESKKDQREGGKLREELQRQKVLLEESGKRLQGMKKDGGDPRRVRENLEEIQRKLSEQVDRWGKKKPQEGKWKGNKGNKANERDHWKKEDKREWKPTKEGQWPKERRDKDERKEKEWKSPKPNSHKESWRRHQDEWERKKGERRVDREERRKEKPWHSKPAKNHHHHHQQHQHQQQPRKPHHNNDFWRDQEQKLRRNVRVLTGCASAEDCAAKEGLFPVELPEFEELLEGYLSKLEGSPPEGKDRLRRLTADFFEAGVFIHDRALFSDFAEDVADILEDMVDVLGGKDDNDSLEEEMEEFEREALWKFAATP